MAEILIVDDSVDFAQFLGELLKREGHEPVIAHNGQKAIEKINKQEFDIIITDLIMPGLDGVGLLHYLDKTGNKKPVIVLSGGGVTMRSDEALKAVEKFADCVFTKPVDYKALIEKITEFTSQDSV